MTADDVMTLPLVKQAKPSRSGRCRTNSRRGLIDPNRYSYAPVEAVSRAFDVLAVVNRLGVASIDAIHNETGFPKPTIVRMLETLIFKGFVAKDNMIGGYRITSHVLELFSGYGGVPRIIELSRPFAIELTRDIKWPVGIGVVTGQEILIQLWTGTISPIAHTNTVLGIRPDMQTSAMGRCYLAMCSAADREKHFERFRRDPRRKFDQQAESDLLRVLAQVREVGYATRDRQTEPHRTATVAMPIMAGSEVRALISVSFFHTAVRSDGFAKRIIGPLAQTTRRINAALADFEESNPRVADEQMPDLQF